eukprot:scaffold41550_cov17-Tisochrysis_lutea.AAC.1
MPAKVDKVVVQFNASGTQCTSMTWGRLVQLEADPCHCSTAFLVVFSEGRPTLSTAAQSLLCCFHKAWRHWLTRDHALELAFVACAFGSRLMTRDHALGLTLEAADSEPPDYKGSRATGLTPVADLSGVKATMPWHPCLSLWPGVEALGARRSYALEL